MVQNRLWGIGDSTFNEKGPHVVPPEGPPSASRWLIHAGPEEQGTPAGAPRFSDILRSASIIERRFRHAMEEFGDDGGYTLVYPIKVTAAEVGEIVRRRPYGVGLNAQQAGAPGGDS